MKFNSLKNKIFNVWNDTQTNNYTIELQSRIQDKLNLTKAKINKVEYDHSTPIDLSSDYEPLVLINPDASVTGYASLTVHYDLLNFPEKWIPKINCEVLWMTEDINNGITIPTVPTYASKVIGVQDISGNDFYKNVSIDIGCLADYTDLTYSLIQAKVLLYILVPTIYL